MTTAPYLAEPIPWGDRTDLLPKAMRYALSFDMCVEMHGASLIVEQTPVLSLTKEGHDSAAPALRHLFGHTVLTTPDGLRCDVPKGSVASGSGELGDRRDPYSPWLRLIVRTEVADSLATVEFDCTGVVSFDGRGPAPGLSSMVGAPLPR